MQWGNTRRKTTVHRVSDPLIITKRRSEGEGTIPERFSVAFFGALHSATSVEPLPCYYNNQILKAWVPINAGEYLRKKGAAMYV